jgi:hypothetical protein
VRECYHASLTVGCLSQQVTDSGPHFHGGSPIALDRSLQKEQRVFVWAPLSMNQPRFRFSRHRNTGLLRTSPL